MTTPQTPLAPQPLSEHCAQTMCEDDAATQKLGMEIVSVSPGAATLTMRVTRDMVNGHNTCHGGYLFTLADSCFAFACNTYNRSEEHTSELQSRGHLVCRLLLEKKKQMHDRRQIQ